MTRPCPDDENDPLARPLGTPCYHFIAIDPCISWPPVLGVPPGLAVEALCVQLDAGQLTSWSPVTTFTAQ